MPAPHLTYDDLLADLRQSSRIYLERVKKTYAQDYLPKLITELGLTRRPVDEGEGLTGPRQGKIGQLLGAQPVGSTDPKF